MSCLPTPIPHYTISNMQRPPQSPGLLALAIVACALPTAETTTTSITTHEVVQTTQPTPTTSTTTGHPDPTTDPAPTTTDPTGPDPTTTTIPDFGEQNLGCNGKIDFLFVLDRANWMEPYLDRFLAAFPPFLDDLLVTFAGFDLHFMVVDSSNGWGLTDCPEQCQENNGSCVPLGPPDYPCEHYEEDHNTECDIIGSGVVFPAGFGASNHDCGVVGDRRFVVADEQPDLLDTLKCISQVGYAKGSGKPDAAMVWSLAPWSPLNTCNEGFLRDDALLVIVFYSALADDESVVGPPGEWADTIYQLKDYDEDKVAVIGLVDDSSAISPTKCPPGNGSYSEYPAAFLHFYVKHRIEGSICADDYSPYLNAGLDLVRDLCDAEIPK